MNFVEEMINKIVIEVVGSSKLVIEGKEVDFKSPWNRVSMIDELKKETDINVLEISKEELAKEVKKRGAKLSGGESKGKLIDESKHLILKAAHPSPLSAYNGFFGCKHFSATNQYLNQVKKDPIDWSI